MTIQTTARTKVSRSTLQRENLLQAQSERVEMTLNTDSAIASGLLIQRLTELYEDPIQASVRETVSNALDAVAESYDGETGEVHITSPTKLNPVLTIKDNGVGMSYEDLKNVYSKYGASTKMDNFDQIGAYGLGAKAPLAYGTEFTVTSVKNGEKTTVIVVREELTNYIKIVDTEQTDEPSGTTVSIPVSTNDVSSFEEEIENYKKYPLEKENVRIFVDGKEYTGDEYFEVSDNLVIFREGEEVVTGRLWVKKSSNLLVNLLSRATVSSIQNSLKFLIGGWGYDTPNARAGYYQSKEEKDGILVELKPGVVAFNSSRDAILKNDRFVDLEDLVIEHIESEEFSKSLIKAVNGLDLESFKRVVVLLMLNMTNNLYFDGNKINVSFTNTSTYYNKSMRVLEQNYSLSDFIHESGFTFNTIFSGIPSKERVSLIYKEYLAKYRKTPSLFMSNHSTSKYNDKGEIAHRNMRDIQVSYGREVYEQAFLEDTEKEALEYTDSLYSALLTVTLRSFDSSNTPTALTIVTDVSEAESKEFQDVYRSRRLLSMIALGEEKSDYESFIIYTNHTKAEMEEMMKKSELNLENLNIGTAKEISEELRAYRKKNRTTPTGRTVNKGLQVSLNALSYDGKNSNFERTTSEELENMKKKGKHIFFVVSKPYKVSSPILKGMVNWICNTKNLKKEDVVLVNTVGQHRKLDLEILMEIGEVYQDYLSDEQAGTSSLYVEKVYNNKIGLDYIDKKSENLERIAFELFLGRVSRNAEILNSNLASLVDAFNSLSDLTGYEKVDEEVIVNLNKDVDSDSINILRYSNNQEALERVVGYLSKESKEALEAVSSLGLDYASSSRIKFEGNKMTYLSLSPFMAKVEDVSFRELREILENEDEDYYTEHIVASAKNTLAFYKKCLDKIAAINI